MPGNPDDAFAPALGCLVEPHLADLTAQLRTVGALGRAERVALVASLREQLYQSVHRRVARVLVLELHAARVTGALHAPDPAGRWDEFLARAAGPDYWRQLGSHYPTLLPRLRTLIGNRCAAARALAGRFAVDRPALAALVPDGPGDLTRVDLGAGDSHRNGQTVAILRCHGGPVVYKPRSVVVDTALADLLSWLLPDEPATTRVRVPAALPRDGYGWTGYEVHRYCADDAELAAFYRGLGHWAALMRLLGGTDLHAENVIAVGPVPVVVDCETLFTPLPPQPPSGYGRAVDRATALIEGTALRTGLLPGRGVALGWRGVDMSAGGSLPGQQPMVEQPVIVDAGTDRARLGTASFEVTPAANHPSPAPALAAHWRHVLAGFDELTERLAAQDRAGRLAPRLAAFADCPVRVVPRGTEVYAELGRMLWHPVSLHDEPAAVARATRLLTAMARYAPLAPADPEVVGAEVAELLDGDVPFFDTVPRDGRLTGPRGTTWLPAEDLVDGALRRWRQADLDREREVIRATLVSAYLNEGYLPRSTPMPRARPVLDDLDRRRRRLAAATVRRVAATAVHADDGTVTWIAPVLNATGWAVQPLNPDVYNGAAGVAVLLAGYQREVDRGRADPVDGVDALRDAVLRTLRLAPEQRSAQRRAGAPLRPPPSGGYVGAGSQIWAWLLLDRWGVAGPDGLGRAVAAAAEIDPDDGDVDLLTGAAGAVVPLLCLAERTGDPRWRSLATTIGDRLVAAATVTDGLARWPSARWPEGLGGYAHGATGVGWALCRLATATGLPRFAAVADAARGYEESLFDPVEGGWRDLRNTGITAAAWCHGAVGIGLAALDSAPAPDRIDRGLLRRAADATWATGLGWGHSLCHGDLGAWELLDAAVAHGVGPAGLDRRTLAACVIGGLEEHGPVTGLAREAFSPGLISGEGGIAYQLLRMHPDCDLPSVLLPGGGTR
ncbi:type 2 lanthipeptide synthetase LanM family protein [Micromonospora sp. WMMD882]|uniref:type 2 lanthipeptide synthetase LanM family protein n=1 Tax=Micromonospora sp. WMMD882 TaxID=3015151 RepID=UPI00248A9FA4|nr:type 2 lanthipeptide synthetase LanM family protein [Micromonospora sp. WMMD882]WBB80307.1 type 2 lanthipeptide synthetase LanM family protein [Micromonospora sp. WMMD882]